MTLRAALHLALWFLLVAALALRREERPASAAAFRAALADAAAHTANTVG